MLADARPSLDSALRAAAFTTLERRLVVRSDAPEIMEYLCSAYRRARVPMPDEGDCGPIDVGNILANNGAHWLTFDGEPVDYPEEKPATHFRLAFYGSSKLIRLSLRRNDAWYSLYAAALCLTDKAVVISAQSGIGKTTLALELMARGARFLSDEFVFIRKRDRMVSGLPRGMLIRERTLSIFDDERLRSVCAATPPRMPHGDRVWDNIDPGDVFGEQVFAQPAPLAAAILLERGQGLAATVEPIHSAVAAADFGKRVNAERTPLDRLADSALMLSGVPCYRVTAHSPTLAADAIEALLR